MIELTEKEITELKLRVFKRIEAELMEQLRKEIHQDPHNLTGEIRNQVVQKASNQLLEKLEVDTKTDDLIEKVFRCIEGRVNEQIKQKLSKGIQLKLGGL